MRNTTPFASLVLLVASVTLACTESPKSGVAEPSASPPKSATSKQWYEGGTLHKKTAREWNSADSSDRMATSADFMASIAKISSMSELKKKATEMERCITNAVKPPTKTPEVRVTDLAAACAILLGYSK